MVAERFDSSGLLQANALRPAGLPSAGLSPWERESPRLLSQGLFFFNLR